ncbi:MAG: DAK2 domain-containing protein [Clostridia bacterium]
MNNVTIGGKLLKEMFLCGAAVLERNKKAVDALNVFPVPDGDTGTNMSMTMQSAARELSGVNDNTVASVAKAASMGALKGARGNSGVILSQILRGFSSALKESDEMDAELLKRAFSMGSESAYKAVMKPREGTMLTVVRIIAETLELAVTENPNVNVFALIDLIIETGEATLKKTPDLLPVLKEAGVVDSGGMGLLCLFNGFKMAIDGDSYEDFALASDEDNVTDDDNDALLRGNVDDIEFGYCTEFFIIHPSKDFSEDELDKFRDKLIRIGDSVVLASDDGFVKVHVHSNYPGKIIQLALRLGEVDKIKIENMREQNREIAEQKKKNEKEMGIVVVCSGDGIEAVFNELSVSCIINGGQTMNPSIESINAAICKANARNVFVFPNNSNIIMAAQQAATLSDKNVFVIPTKTIMQGISGVMAYNPDVSVSENLKRMNSAFKSIISGAVTYAVRDTTVNGQEIHEGDIIGLIDNKISIANKDIFSASRLLLEKMIALQPEDTVITVFYGENVSKDDAENLISDLEKDYEDAEFILQYGGQSLYYYYFSVE